MQSPLLKVMRTRPDAGCATATREMSLRSSHLLFLPAAPLCNDVSNAHDVCDNLFELSCPCPLDANVHRDIFSLARRQVYSSVVMCFPVSASLCWAFKKIFLQNDPQYLLHIICIHNTLSIGEYHM